MSRIAKTNARVVAPSTLARRKSRTHSWMPPANSPLGVLDPQHWSDRRRDQKRWQLLEFLNGHRTLH